MPPEHRLFTRVQRFAHAVNCRARLVRFVGGPATIAEGDVSWAELEGSPTRELIMAHPPVDRSDLTFAEWVEAAAATGRAIKVDFKVASAIEPALAILRAAIEPSRVVLNADFVRGPGGPAPDFDADDLAAFEAGLPGAVASIGTTTGSGGGPYLREQLDELIDLAGQTALPVTVPVRLELIDADPSALAPLVHAGLHLSVWNHGNKNPADPTTAARVHRQLPGAWIDLADADGEMVLPAALAA